MDTVESWQEVAVAVHDCIEHEWNGTTYYLGHVCQDGDFDIDWYTNENCTGTPFWSETHWAQEGICPEVTCNATNLYTSAPTWEPTIQPSVEPSGEPTVEPSAEPSAEPTLTSLPATTEEPDASLQCNGAVLDDGMMVWPADVCLNANDKGNMTSHMIVCEDDGSGSIHLWNHGHCQGDALMEESLSSLFGESVDMVCDAIDCDYAIIREYETDNATSSSSSESESESAESAEIEALCHQESGSWREHAIVVDQCMELGDIFDVGTTIYLNHACDHAGWQMEYHTDEQCEGTPAYAESHFEMGGLCPEVTCSWATTTTTTIPTTTTTTEAAEETTMEPTLAPLPATCNGLKVWEEKNPFGPTLTPGHVTHPADVCMNVMEDGAIMSRKVVCDEYGAGVILQWNVSDCQGDYSMSDSVDDVFDEEQHEMVCDAEDCGYAVVKTYHLEDSEESEDDIDCSANDMSIWEEVAFTLYDCEHSGYEVESEELGTFPVYVSNACEDGGITMQYYAGSDCEAGGLLGSTYTQVEDHPAVLDGLCPEVTCVTSWPTTSTLTPTQDGAATMNYLIAVGFTLIVMLLRFE